MIALTAFVLSLYLSPQPPVHPRTHLVPRDSMSNRRQSSRLQSQSQSQLSDADATQSQSESQAQAQAQARRRPSAAAAPPSSPSSLAVPSSPLAGRRADSQDEIADDGASAPLFHLSPLAQKIAHADGALKQAVRDWVTIAEVNPGEAVLHYVNMIVQICGCRHAFSVADLAESVEQL